MKHIILLLLLVFTVNAFAVPSVPTSASCSTTIKCELGTATCFGPAGAEFASCGFVDPNRPTMRWCMTNSAPTGNDSSFKSYSIVCCGKNGAAHSFKFNRNGVTYADASCDNPGQIVN